MYTLPNLSMWIYGLIVFGCTVIATAQLFRRSGTQSKPYPWGTAEWAVFGLIVVSLVIVVCFLLWALDFVRPGHAWPLITALAWSVTSVIAGGISRRREKPLR